MLKKSKTVALDGMKGELVDIETDISNGLPYFTIIGLADASVREASERVKRAIINSGYSYPKGKITVNLSPAYIPKKGSHYDLGIAVGVVLSGKAIDTENMIFIGELSFDGRVLPVKGVLPMIMSVIEKEGVEIKEIYLAEANCSECYLFTRKTNTRLIPIRTLRDVIDHMEGMNIIEAYRDNCMEYQEPKCHLDYKDVKGQIIAKEAIMTAIAGNHNILLIGPPGSGKTMLARRTLSILPQMSEAEQIEATKVYSYAGKLSKEQPIICDRPFRHVTPGITVSSLIGGGNYPLPGEVSFAHNGVLFMDELLEYPSKILESLRNPMEDKYVQIVRKRSQVTFPSDFILVAATNPCKCGFLGDEHRRCSCTQSEINNYRSKLSGALLDRIDITVEISRIDFSYLDNGSREDGGLTSDIMKERISRAKRIQAERYKDYQFNANGNIRDKYIDKFCKLDEASSAFIKDIYHKQNISPRRYYKILKVARTIADIKEKENIELSDVATAFHYTRFLTERPGEE